MTQEEKELLIKDLCGRLPYGLIIKCNDGFRQSKEKLVSIDVGNELINYDWLLTDIKPYLRSISSMTEEEKEELRDTYDWVYNEYPFDDEDEDEDDLRDLRNVEDVGGHYEPSAETYDWYNRKGFDYRGLIPKGLALEAPEEMYN